MGIARERGNREGGCEGKTEWKEWEKVAGVRGGCRSEGEDAGVEGRRKGHKWGEGGGEMTCLIEKELQLFIGQIDAKLFK